MMLRANNNLERAMWRLLEVGGARAVSRTTQLRGLSLHSLELGAGPPVVLLHGASGGAANWFRILAPLARRHRVVALDLPGFGLSDAIEPERPLGLHLAGLVLDWLAVLGLERFSVVATSFGGLVALRMAQRSPERAEAVALLDSAGLGVDLPFVLRAACLRPLARAALRPSRRGTEWQFTRLMVRDPRHLSVEQSQALLEFLWEVARAMDRRRLARAFRMFGGLRGQREVMRDDELRAIQARLLILWGEHDRFLPRSHGQRAAGLVQRATFRIIPGVGHSPNWEAPEAVLECLTSFLPGGPVA